MVDKVKAIKLRQEGLSYKEIAKELECSEIWCKKNLKDTQKDIKEVDLIKDLTTKALSSTGVSKYEIIKSFVNEHMNEDDINTTLKRYMRKIKATEGAIIRPSWIIPEKASESFRLILEAVNNMEERLDEAARDICIDLGVPQQHSERFKRGIGTLMSTNSTLNATALVSYCEALAETCLELDKRNE